MNGPVQAVRLGSQRHLFDMPRDAAYLNAASYAPLPHSVRAAGIAGMESKTAPWTIDRAADDRRVERLRGLAARLIGADAGDIAITGSVSYGIATAGRNLAPGAGTRILIAENEFPSQTLEWVRLADQTGAVLDVVPRPADADWGSALLERIDAPGAPPVSIAALTPLHWTDGTLMGLERVLPALRAQGAAIVLDATQAVGIVPIDVRELRPDFMVFPTYKWLLGPYSLGFLYAAPHRQNGSPLEQHSTSRMSAVPYSASGAAYTEGARRYDIGERNDPICVPMAIAGLELVLGWNLDAMGARMRELTDLLAARVAELGITAVPRAFRAPHILGLRLPEGRADGLVERLAAANVFVGNRLGVLRLSVHVYSDEADVARFIETLRAALKG